MSVYNKFMTPSTYIMHVQDAQSEICLSNDMDQCLLNCSQSASPQLTTFEHNERAKKAMQIVVTILYHSMTHTLFYTHYNRTL